MTDKGAMSLATGKKPFPYLDYGSLDLREKIERRTSKRIKQWTQGAVRTSSLDRVMDRLNTRVTWITIKGRPGEGKTTTAYMALGELQKSGKQVYQTFTPEEFCVVATMPRSLNGPGPIIMVDDIFGHHNFDQTMWSRWRPVLLKVIRTRSIQKQKRYRADGEATVILVGRDTVLDAASGDIARLYDFFTHESHVVNMPGSVARRHEEKLAILKMISCSKKNNVDEKTVDIICHTSIPHGFPHTCQLFVNVHKECDSIYVDDFFMSPLEFLNQRIQQFMQDTPTLLLFKEMIKMDGKVGVHELQKFRAGDHLIEKADNVVGSYIRKDNEEGNEYFMFDHPSIYDCVAFNLCRYHTRFVIEHCSISFLHERLHLEPPPDTKNPASCCESGFVAHISRSYIKDLAKRFAVEVSNGNLIHVLSHQSMTDECFIAEMMALVVFPQNNLLRRFFTKNRTEFLSFVASSGSPHLLEYLHKEKGIHLTPSEASSVLHGVCQYAASSVLTYLLQICDSLDMNVHFGDDRLTPVMIAAETRDVQFVHYILSLKPDLTACDWMGKSVLHYFCENGLVSAVGLVIDGGAGQLHRQSPDLQLKQGLLKESGTTFGHFQWQPPESFLKQGSSPQVFAGVSNINVMDLYGRSPLWYACRSNQVEVVKLLLDRGARVDAETLVDSCSYGYIDVVNLLFEGGARVNMATNFTPLTEACRSDQVQMIRLLLDKGANWSIPDSDGESPLHVACRYKKPRSVQCLLQHGADCEIRDKHENTPLHLAAWRMSSECVAVLVKTGCNVNAQNEYGNTPLHRAADMRSKECIEILLKAGADVNVGNRRGSTPLHRAVASGAKECVEVLLKAGAAIEATDSRGRTPLHNAVYFKEMFGIPLPDIPIYQTLIREGADINRRDRDGNSPLSLLCQVGSKTNIDVPKMPYQWASRYEDLYRTLVTLLINDGADANMRNCNGEPALRDWCQSLVESKKLESK